ncbi:MAG: sigma-70 family RNA polymerase sigma factor [Isosphaeraceae bacterium]
MRLGDRDALAALFQDETEPLSRWIERRLDTRLRGRVSPADLLQEVYLAAQERLEHYGKLKDMPFGVWVRLLAGQRLAETHRRHFGAWRDRSREVSLDAGSGSAVLAARLAGHFTTPSRAAIRHETIDRLTRAIDGLDPVDREILRLRHFEELSNNDVARRLGLTKSAATKRYIRALARLKSVLEQVPGLLTSWTG